MTLVDGTLVVSNSELQAFKRCRRKWYLNYYRELRPNEVEKVGARSTGSRVHKALEHYYTPEGTGRVNPLVTLLAAQADAKLALEQEFGGWELVPEHLASGFTKAVDLEKAMVEGYVEWLAQEGQDAELHVVKSEAELKVPFDVPGVNVPVYIVGKLDVRARWRYAGADLRVFLDHKTCADFAKPAKFLPQDEQGLHYLLLERLAFPDEPRVAGVLYNLLRKVKRTAAAKPPFYQRLFVQHNAYQVESYERRLRATVADLWAVRQKLDSGVEHYDTAYPTRGDSCAWGCDYATLCPLFDDGSRAEDFVAANFSTHNPLDRYTTKEDED